MNKLLSISLTLLAAVPLAWGDEPKVQQKPGAKAAWKKTVVDKEFRSEGVAVADFNKDGKMDLFVGDCWYEAPDWKRHVVRRDKPYEPINYSECFGCFAGDFNGDGYPDVIVAPFPGKACNWYENPAAKGDKWREHILASSACNETPIYIDLFKNGKKVLVMGWQPPDKEDMGEMCYFSPGADPTKLWEKRSISGPSEKGKEIPGTRRFSHGLGHGDINGDGRLDVLTPDGWWEQPEKIDDMPWKFHRAPLGPICADMHTHDVDGDGKVDVLSSSAHNTGLWWHQQKEGKDGPTFVRHDLFPLPATLAKEPKDHPFSKDEQTVYAALNRARGDLFRAPWRTSADLCKMARAHAEALGAKGGKSAALPLGHFKEGALCAVIAGRDSLETWLKLAMEGSALKNLVDPRLEVGIGYARGQDGNGYFSIIVSDQRHFALPAQSHALHFVDMDGDGLKDLVTGRRYWAHGPSGDDFPADPAYLYWYRAVKNGNKTDFIPELVDDDSGIGTQFAVIDINGDGIPDIIVSNKKGVFIFEQVRAGAAPGVPPRRD